ncbi:MAG: tetratricopeptide repeat protein [Myxococcales bacterium]|nr:tetratricopeptide repeat protein [Myxococcales bacterium]
MRAKSADARASWALRGLARRGPLDPTTNALLLRQLYLAHYVAGAFERAYEISCQAVTLGVLEDVIHQDAARAKQAAGDVDGAVGHLRLAARRAPPSRRAFHWWTLGAVLFVAHRHSEAIDALARAARWGTTDKPLYQGHLALAKCESGVKVRGLPALIARLEACPAGQGYGRFVLGQLSYHLEQLSDAAHYLDAFVERTTRGHLATAIALAGELAIARRTLSTIRRAS